MLNKVILTGNMGRTPKVWLTHDGREIATFYLGTNVSWKDTNNKWQTCTEWHRITVFRESTVEWIKDALKKGDSLYVEGKLSYHHWTDKYGQSRLTPHIVVSNREGRIQYLRSSNIGQGGTSHAANDSQRSESIAPAFGSSNEESLSTQPCPPSTDSEDSSQQENN